MESAVKQKCQWKGCGSPAEKHAVMGTSVFEAPDDVHTSKGPDTTQHFDVCEKHLELARLQYIHFHEYKLDECPEPAKDR
jgi:hypothetical protein